eukprot:SAG31_NODE_146_length_22601_cov_56.529192_5_plen_65_part_00
MLSGTAFEQVVQESESMWLVMYSGGQPKEKLQCGLAKPNFLRLGSDLCVHSTSIQSTSAARAMC